MVRRDRCTLFAVLTLLLAAPALGQTTWYVDDDTCPAMGDGSIGNPFCQLSDAIAVAVAGDTIELAAGTYGPPGSGSHVIGGGQNITINGAGADVTIVSNGGMATADPVFVVLASVTIRDLTIADGNKPSGSAGGMITATGTTLIERCRFTNNIAGQNGGGASAFSGTTTFRDCLFDGNQAQNGGGGGAAVQSSGTASFVNCTFADNTSTMPGGAIFAQSGATVTIENTVAWGDTAPELAEDDPGQITVTTAIVEGGFAGGTNVSTSDPLFVDAAMGDYRLGASSPAVDAGDNAPAAPSTADLDGNARFVDDTGVADTGTGMPPIVDLGAYERQTTSGPATLLVPSQYATIQAAIDAASSGDTIEVSAGTYFENIVIAAGKPLDIVGPSGAGETIVDASAFGRPLYIDAGPLRIEGLTLTNGATTNGGGVFVTSAGTGVTIAHCRITANSASNHGGGLFVSSADVQVIGCLVDGNTASNQGGGVYGSLATSIVSSTIADNASAAASAVFVPIGPPVTIANSIVWDNTGSPFLFPPAAVNSIVQDGAGGGLDVDPEFQTGANAAYRLSRFSPAIDAGDNAALPMDETLDLDGAPRFVDDAAVADTGIGAAPIIDLGAYERQVDSDAPLMIAVPGDFATIQGALDQAVDGDVIEIGPGTYLEMLAFDDTIGSVTLVGTAGADATIIEPPGFVTLQINIASGLPGVATIRGLTLSGGIYGVEIDDTTAPTNAYEVSLIGCRITGSSQAVVSDGGAPVALTNCVIDGNNTLGGNLIIGDPIVLGNSTIAGNDSMTGTLLSLGPDSEIRNSVIWGNVAAGILAGGPGVTSSIVQGGAGGGLDVDPRFVDESGGDYRLNRFSPAADAGDNPLAPADPLDYDGADRLVDDGGVDDTGAGTAPIVDLGAFERQTDSEAVFYEVPAQYGTIQAALDAAIATGVDEDVISIAPGTYMESVVWSELHTVSLVGNPADPASTVIDATGTGGAVLCATAPTSGATAPVQVRGLTLRGGTTAFVAAGLDLQAQEILVEDCIIEDNDGTGMALWAFPDGATVRRCIVRNNTSSTEAGGITFVGTAGNDATIESCEVTGNVTAAGVGGIDQNNAGTLVVSGSLIAQNAGSAVGGIAGDAGLTVRSCTVADNLEAPGANVAGGIDGGTVVNSIVWGNESPQIGATTVISSSIVEGGAAGTNNFDANPRFEDAPGGDYRLGEFSPCVDLGDELASFPATDLDGCPTQVDDAGVENTFATTLDVGAYERQVDSVSATLNVPGMFATIQAAVDAAEIGDVIDIAPGTYNEAVTWSSEEKYLALIGDPANPAGTVIDATGTSLPVIHVVGSAPESPKPETVILQGLTLQGGVGGGIIFQTAGGAHLDAVSMLVEDCVIEANAGTGLVLRGHSDDAVVRRCLIRNNAGDEFSSGGGVWIFANTGGTTLIEACRILENHAEFGGGIYGQGSGTTCDIVNTLVAGNTAVGYGGVYGESFRLFNCTVTDNDASDPGAMFDNTGGVYGADEIRNCIVRGNLRAGAPSDVRDTVVAGMTWSNVGGYGGFGTNFDVDPLFVDPDGGDYRLGDFSPCVDSGDDASIAATTDLDGNPRFVDDAGLANTGPGVSTVDLGAFERQADSVSATLAVPGAFATIQSAVDAADAGDVIQIAPGTYNESIAWSSGDKFLTLLGDPGNPAGTVIDATSGSVISVTGPPSDSPKPDAVAIRGLTLTGGSRGADLEAQSMLVEDCIIEDNSGTGLILGGFTSSTTVRRCVIRSNNAGAGSVAAGIRFDDASSSAVIDACRVTDNSAEFQGGIYSAFPVEVTIANTLVANNFTEAGSNSVSGAGFRLRNCTIARNFGPPIFPVGVGAFDTMVNCIVWQTSGGVSFGQDVTWSNVEGGYPGTGNFDADPDFVDDSPSGDFRLLPFSPCIDSGRDADVFSSDGSDLDLDGNARFAQDAGVIDTGPFGSTVDVGAFERQDDSVGATIAVPGDQPTIQDAVNASSQGDTIVIAPGVYAESVFVPSIRGYLTFVGDPADPSTTVIDAAGTGDHVLHVFGEIDDNPKPETAEVRGLTFRNGTDAGERAGGLNVRARSILVEDCVAEDNTGGGFAIEHFGDAATIRRCAARNNTGAIDGGGIAVINWAGGTASIESCIVESNQADVGGGIGTDAESLDAPVTIVNTLVFGNAAVETGGGIAGGASFAIVNCTIADNYTTGPSCGSCFEPDPSGGPGCSDAGCEAIVCGMDPFCCIDDWDASCAANAAANCDCSLGGGLAGDVTVGNSIIWDNEPNAFTGNAVFTYSVLPGGAPGEGNVNAFPGFVSPGAGNYRLQSNSLLREAGSNAAVPAGIAVDLDGGDRILDGDLVGGAVVDMGAYEFDPLTAALVANVTQQTVEPSLVAAVADAAPGDVIEATPLAFGVPSMLDVPAEITVRSLGNLAQPAGSAWTLGDESTLETAPAGAMTLDGLTSVGVLDRATIVAGSFDLGATGALTLAAGASLEIESPGSTATLSGTTELASSALLAIDGDAVVAGPTTVDPFAVLAASGSVDVTGSIDLNGGAVSVGGSLAIGASGSLTGYGDLVGDVSNAGQASVLADLRVVGDLDNTATGTIDVLSGTLTVLGSLTNDGTITGDVSNLAGGSGPPPELMVDGDLVLGAGSTFRLSRPGSILRVTGNVDIAIDDTARLDLWQAELRLVGSGTQQLELLSVDLGPVVEGLDPMPAGHFPLGALTLGPTGPTVELVDAHDNDGAGQAMNEAGYVSSLTIAPEATLLTNGLNLYYEFGTLDGTIDAPGDVQEIDATPPCLGDTDASGAVDIDDIVNVVLDFGTDGSTNGGDVDGSGVVDIDDIVVVILNFGACPGA